MGIFGRKDKSETIEDSEESSALAKAEREEEEDRDDDEDDEEYSEETVYEPVAEEPSSKNGVIIALSVVLVLVAVGGAWAKGYISIPGLNTPGAPVVASSSEDLLKTNLDTAALVSTGSLGGIDSQAIASGAVPGPVINPNAGAVPKETLTVAPIVPPVVKSGPTGLVKERAAEDMRRRVDSVEQARAVARAASEARLAEKRAAEDRADSTRAAQARLAAEVRVRDAQAASKASGAEEVSEGATAATPAPKKVVRRPRVNTANLAFDDPRAPWNQSGSKIPVRTTRPREGAYDDPNATWNRKP